MTEMNPSEPGSEGTGEGVNCPWCGKKLHQIADHDSFVCENYHVCPWTGHGMPKSSWVETWANKRIEELTQHAVNLTGALNLEKSQHEKAGVEFSKLNKQLTDSAFELAQDKIELQRRNAELESINRQDWNKSMARITELERQLKEAKESLQHLYNRGMEAGLTIKELEQQLAQEKHQCIVWENSYLEKKERLEKSKDIDSAWSLLENENAALKEQLAQEKQRNKDLEVRLTERLEAIENERAFHAQQLSRLQAELKMLRECDCGRELSDGLFKVCDNDE